ncbi:DUF6660 family protein [Chryseolinea lacunae]|uniref:Secreted protein n=1 Tax=Chryseolinea lacunae TaxID=2801331 RepID=A0ABS1L040_9BACT|nr:DUF6660 family protein [Chryseolinea lacunae]MBL0745081.1 hypothetical protein [Chryseolinea lacunae]
MKPLHIILAFYLLLLACYPCSDAEACPDNNASTVSIFTPYHQHIPGEPDHCSPFCICSCCASSVPLTTAHAVVPASPEHNSSFVTPYLDKHILHSQTSIWQPPRLS